MLSPESIQTSGEPCPSGTHSTLSTTTSTLDVFDFASSTRTIRTPVTAETTVPTWDGNKTNQTTFLLDLWDYCKGKPDLLTFIIHGIIALPNGKTLVPSDTVAQELAGQVAAPRAYDWDNPRPPTPAAAANAGNPAPNTRAAAVQPPAAPAVDAARFTVNPNHINIQDQKLLATICGMITDKSKSDTLYAQSNGSGRALLAELRRTAMLDLQPAQVTTLINRRQKIIKDGVSALTAPAFSKYKDLLDRAELAMPAAHRLPPGMRAAAYIDGLARNDLDLMRRLHSHFTVHKVELTDATATSASILTFLETEELLIGSAAQPQQPRPSPAPSSDVRSLVAQVVAALKADTPR